MALPWPDRVLNVSTGKNWAARGFASVFVIKRWRFFSLCHLVAGKRAHMTSLECLSPLQETKSFSLSDEDPVTFLFSLFCVVCLVLKLVPEKKHSCSAHFSLISKFYLFLYLMSPLHCQSLNLDLMTLVVCIWPPNLGHSHFGWLSSGHFACILWYFCVCLHCSYHPSVWGKWQGPQGTDKSAPERFLAVYALAWCFGHILQTFA